MSVTIVQRVSQAPIVRVRPRPLVRVRTSKRVVRTKASGPSVRVFGREEVVVQQNVVHQVKVIETRRPTVRILERSPVASAVALQEDFAEIAARHSDGSNIVFAGEARVSSPDITAAIWQVYRVDTETGEVTYADGNQNFDKVWDSSGGVGTPTYETYTYS